MKISECFAKFGVVSEVCTTEYIKEFYGDKQDFVNPDV